jgi:proteasome lid subunit RPN8/RPN11
MIKLTVGVVRAMIRHAEEAETEEACGLVAAAGGNKLRYLPVRNVAAVPAKRYEMDPKEQIAAFRAMRQRGETLLAIFHSHPNSPALPSVVDLAEAAYPEAIYLIASSTEGGGPGLRAFRIRGGRYEEEELVIT